MGGLIDPSIELVVSVMAVTTMAIARMIAAMRRRFFPPARSPHSPQTYVITWQSLGLQLGNLVGATEINPGRARAAEWPPGSLPPTAPNALAEPGAAGASE